jgi:hypothetical protein
MLRERGRLQFISSILFSRKGLEESTLDPLVSLIALSGCVFDRSATRHAIAKRMMSTKGLTLAGIIREPPVEALIMAMLRSSQTSRRPGQNPQYIVVSLPGRDVFRALGLGDFLIPWVCFPRASRYLCRMTVVLGNLHCVWCALSRI